MNYKLDVKFYIAECSGFHYLLNAYPKLIFVFIIVCFYFNQGRSQGEGPPPYGEKLYHTLEKKQGKIKGKGEKSGGK